MYNIIFHNFDDVQSYSKLIVTFFLVAGRNVIEIIIVAAGISDKI